MKKLQPVSSEIAAPDTRRFAFLSATFMTRAKPLGYVGGTCESGERAIIGV